MFMRNILYIFCLLATSTTFAQLSKPEKKIVAAVDKVNPEALKLWERP